MGREGFGKLFSLQEALDSLFNRLELVTTESINFSEAKGRILREDIVATLPVPSFAKSAMDGFAVIAEDTFKASQSSPITLTCRGEVVPGEIFKGTITSGQCVEIATGAPLPSGANAVIMVEHVDREGDQVTIYKSVAPSEHVISIGSDLKMGSIVLNNGTRLTPEHIGVISALGLDSVTVSKKPVIAIASTGNELVRPPAILKEGQIYDINFFTLQSAFENGGCIVKDFGITQDNLDKLTQSIQDMSREADIVILSGGSSLGTSDYLVQAIETLGKVYIHGIAVKPGKPTIIGRIGSQWIFGLPGHPTSALSNFYIFLKPMIQKMVGHSKVFPCQVKARLTRKVASTIGRYEFLAVSLEESGEGYLATPTMKGSSAISSMALSDGYIEIEENVEVLEKGTTVMVTLFAS
jgi:molybdenum cofactor synthesis domain-containing protein